MRALARRTVTTGCGQGTVFGRLTEETRRAFGCPPPAAPVAALCPARCPAGSQRGVQARRRRARLRPVRFRRRWHARIELFVEDVGRHNAADAIAGRMWLDGAQGHDKVFYTTGRLTSEMVIKVAQMGIPVLVSRSGITEMGLEFARERGRGHDRARQGTSFPRLPRASSASSTTPCRRGAAAARQRCALPPESSHESAVELTLRRRPEPIHCTRRHARAVHRRAPRYMSVKQVRGLSPVSTRRRSTRWRARARSRRPRSPANGCSRASWWTAGCSKPATAARSPTGSSSSAATTRCSAGWFSPSPSALRPRHSSATAPRAPSSACH